jgi:hypothetical protein
LYLPFLTCTVCPAERLSAAFPIVFQGLVSVPGLESLPAGDTK